MSLRERFGWNDFFEQQTASGATRAGLQWARVVEEQRGLYRVAGDVDGWAEVSGRFRHEARARRPIFPRSATGWASSGASFIAGSSGAARSRARRPGAPSDEQVLGGQRRHDLPGHRARARI